MKHLRFLTLTIAVGAAALMVVGAGTASATVLCRTTASPCPTGWIWPTGTELRAETSSLKFEKANGEVDVKCTGSKLIGRTENLGSPTETVRSKLTQESFEPCEPKVVAIEKGSLEIQYVEKGSGVVTAKGGQWTVVITIAGTPFDCVFGFGSGSSLGTLKEPESSESTSVLEVTGEIFRVGGSPFCPSSERLTGTYTVSPKGLYVAAS